MPEPGEMKAPAGGKQPVERAWSWNEDGKKTGGKKLSEGNSVISWSHESPGRGQRLALDEKQQSPGLTLSQIPANAG